jgi:hypothetical protein
MLYKKLRLSFSEAILTHISISTKVILLRSSYSTLLRRSTTFVESIKIAISASEKLNLNVLRNISFLYKNIQSIKPASLKNACRFLVLGIVFILQTSFLLSPFSSLLSKHDFHTSLTEMRYNIKSKTFEISLRVFTDDLQKVLSTTNQNKKFLVENNDKNDPFVEAYIHKNFVVTNPKNQKLNINYIGKEKEGEATWIYLEMPVNESINGSKIQNNVLIDMFEDQTNILNIFVQNQKRSYLFNVKNRVFVVEI